LSADIYIEEWADAVGVTVEELIESIGRLVEQGWLKPLGNGAYQLTAPPGKPE
jgi:predicted transcriptional regulator of viral defense system